MSDNSQFDTDTRAAMVSDRVATIELLRHGAVREIERRVVRGQLDTGLSDVGMREQAALVARFTAQPVARVVSSDLPRCAGLAVELGKRLGLEVEFAPALREQSLGQWEGRTWQELQVADTERTRDYWRDFVHTEPPGGESFLAMTQRVQAWFDAEYEALLGQTTVLVTHVGPIRALVCRALGIDVAESLRLAPATGSRTRLLCSEAGAVLEVFGERPA